MLLIVDTNVLFSFFRKSKIFELIRKLRKIGIRFVVPDFVYSELSELKEKVLKSSGISGEEFEVMLVALKDIIRSVPESEYEKFLQRAKEISPHLKDAPLFALSLALNKAPIWSREPKLKSQKFINVSYAVNSN